MSMILTCPDCATRYSASAEAIGVNGRTVRCSNCGATWFVSAEPDIMNLRDEEQVGDIVQEKESESVAASSVEAPAGQIAFDSKPAIGAHVQMRNEVDRRRRNQRLLGVSMVWLVTLGFLGLVAAMAYSLRHTIVERFPAAASIYQSFGIKVTSLGLDFENPKISDVIVDGVSSLIVNGYIKNTSSETRTVPMIELSLMNASGEKIVSWLVSPPKEELGPKERMEYVSEYPNYPVEAKSLKYRFYGDNMFMPVADGSEKEGANIDLPEVSDEGGSSIQIEPAPDIKPIDD